MRWRMRSHVWVVVVRIHLSRRHSVAFVCLFHHRSVAVVPLARMLGFDSFVFRLGGLAIYEVAHLDTSDALLAVSAALMLLTSVAFAVMVKVWVYAHNQKVKKARSDETDLDGETVSDLKAGMYWKQLDAELSYCGDE